MRTAAESQEMATAKLANPTEPVFRWQGLHEISVSSDPV